MELAKLTEEVIESKTFLARLEERLSGWMERVDEKLSIIEEEQGKILIQTTLTNGRVKDLERVDTDKLIREVEDLKKQILDIHKKNSDQDTAINAKKELKRDWTNILKWAGWIVAFLVYAFSNQAIKDIVKDFIF